MAVAGSDRPRLDVATSQRLLCADILAVANFDCTLSNIADKSSNSAGKAKSSVQHPHGK